MMNQMSETMGMSLDPIRAPRRAGDIPQLIASIKKIQRELGWKPHLSLKDMIDSSWTAELGNE